MIKMKWSRLNNSQLGRLGEYYAKLLFVSLGWYVYSSEIDDHGVDFISEDPQKAHMYRVQVKSVKAGKDTLNIKKTKMPLRDDFLMCFLRFEDDRLPDVFLWKTSEWNDKSNDALGENNYIKEDTVSVPEWNVKYSKKNAKWFQEHVADKVLEEISGDV